MINELQLEQLLIFLTDKKKLKWDNLLNNPFYSANFKNLFIYLEKNSNEIGINNFSFPLPNPGLLEKSIKKYILSSEDFSKEEGLNLILEILKKEAGE